ncbi:MAG: 2-isopropylmalate synthase, partial [Planctomycetota bacterium]
MTNLDENDLIHDWNAPYPELKERIQFDDETLRDGLQSPSALEPCLEDKIKLVHLMNQLGIDTANVGLPGASQHARDHIAALCREMEKLRITPNVACRTMAADIQPVVDMVQELGSPVEVCAFIGSSGIRMFAEGWDFAKVLGLAKSGVEFAHKEGLPVMFVTEDTARAKPEEVDALYRTAIE